jgi:hypothetical protein
MMPASIRAERQNVISLAEHRQPVSPADKGPPPPAPYPAAARRPAAMLFTNAIARPDALPNTFKAEPASYDATRGQFQLQNAA